MSFDDVLYIFAVMTLWLDKYEKTTEVYRKRKLKERQYTLYLSLVFQLNQVHIQMSEFITPGVEKIGSKQK